MRKTIRNVTMVVPVLITSCQVSEKWNAYPEAPQTKMTSTAQEKAHFDPSQPEANAANLPNQSFVVRILTSVATFGICAPHSKTGPSASSSPKPIHFGVPYQLDTRAILIVGRLLGPDGCDQ